MLQQVIKDNLEKKILLQLDIKAKTETQCRYLDKIIALNENQAFIYYDQGNYEVYDIDNQRIVSSGQIVTDIQYFYQIYPRTITYVDPKTLKVHLLDLDKKELHPMIKFQASKVVKENNDKQQVETVADKFRILILIKDNFRYMITQDLEKQYSNTNTCHFITRKLPLDYRWQANFDFSSIGEYDYPNVTQQTELFNWQVDEETLVVYGQDFEVGEAEILLIKPHLGPNGYYIIHIKDTISYTLINVTNWIEPHKIAIWQNNNDGNAKPTIFTIDIRTYYNGESWTKEPEYVPTKVRDDYVGDEPVTFMDIYQFQLGSSQVLQFRMVGVQPKLSLIDYQDKDNPILINEVKVTDFFHELPSNRSYLLSYNNLEVIDQIVEFSVVFANYSILFPGDARYQLLQIFEEKKIIEKYGIGNVEKIFEFYQ